MVLIVAVVGLSHKDHHQHNHHDHQRQQHQLQLPQEGSRKSNVYFTRMHKNIRSKLSIRLAFKPTSLARSKGNPDFETGCNCCGWSHWLQIDASCSASKHRLASRLRHTPMSSPAAIVTLSKWATRVPAAERGAPW